MSVKIQNAPSQLTHSGFEDEAAAKGHKDNWPLALEELDQKLTSR